MNGVRVTQVVHTRRAAGRGADLRVPEQPAQAIAEPRPRARSKPIGHVHEQGAVSATGESAPRLQIDLHLVHSVRGQRHEARLAKLRGPNEQRAFDWVVVGECQPYDLAAT